MPSLPASPASGKQRSVVLNEDLLVYTSTTTAYRTSVSNPNFESIQWGNLIISGLPSDTKLTSIINFNNRLYTTAESGKAFYSDNGTNWEEMDMQGMYMVTFLAGIPADEVTGSENMLTGIFAKDGKNFFCAKSAGETTWKEGEEVPSDFPLKEIYSTVFTNASGIKQTVVVGNVEETVEATIPWFSKDGLVWADMSTPTDFSCPAMKNPAIMYYGSQFHMMGGEFKTIYSSLAGIAWNESADKFRYASEKVIIKGDEDEEETIEYESLFEGKGDYSLAIDKNHYIWIVWNQDGSVWRGRLNKLGFKQQ